MKPLAVCLLALAALLPLACRNQSGPALPVVNGVYYWRTDWALDSTERDFLKRYDVKKVYCRYFDVVMDGARGPMPNATITFSDSMPAGIEIVPTVFITEDCMHSQHDGLAEKLVKRILQMNETNDIAGVGELQVDCDYTRRSRQVYYTFLQQVRRLAAMHGLRLSTTIRLHQLSMPEPPADYGVLMLYNTGDPKRFHERNPILDMRDVKPYLPHLADYPLPLAAAYPVFLWHRDVYGVQLEHEATAKEILGVKQAVEHERPDISHTVLTYHLDENNINRYTPETYEAIYHH